MLYGSNGDGGRVVVIRRDARKQRGGGVNVNHDRVSRAGVQRYSIPSKI